MGLEGCEGRVERGLGLVGGGVRGFGAAPSALPMKRESARLAAKRHPPFFSADASCRLGRRFQPPGDELRLVSPAAFLLQRDGPALLDAQARAPVSDALLLSFSEPSPWLGQAYSRPLVCR